MTNWIESLPALCPECDESIEEIAHIGMHSIDPSSTHPTSKIFVGCLNCSETFANHIPEGQFLETLQQVVRDTWSSPTKLRQRPGSNQYGAQRS